MTGWGWGPRPSVEKDFGEAGLQHCWGLGLVLGQKHHVELLNRHVTSKNSMCGLDRFWCLISMKMFYKL